MKISVEVNERELKTMVIARLRELMPDVPIEEADVSFLVKTKQNYRAEWEEGSFRASVEKHNYSVQP